MSWESTKQRLVAQSTAGAECYALAEATKESIWLRKILTDLRIPVHSIGLYEDNQACIKIAENPVYHKRTKHIEVRANFVRDHLLKGDITITYISTEHQLADILTKPLAKLVFERLACQLVQYSSGRPWNDKEPRADR